MKPNQIMFSANEEWFDKDSLEEAIEDAAEDAVGIRYAESEEPHELPLQITVYELEFEACALESFLPTDMASWVIEAMDEQACDELGHDAMSDGLFSTAKFDDESLNKKLTEAVTEILQGLNHDPRKWRAVGEIKAHRVLWWDEGRWELA